jgi:flagellin
MAQVINTNVASLFGQQALNKSNMNLQTAMQRLSSGLRINSAKDDASGMVTAAGYESTMRGANQAIRNANDGISTAQINDGYHQQIYDNLQRLREIAVQDGGTIKAANAEATALVCREYANRRLGHRHRCRGRELRRQHGNGYRRRGLPWLPPPRRP